MKYLIYNHDELHALVENLYKKELEKLVDFCYDTIEDTEAEVEIPVFIAIPGMMARTPKAKLTDFVLSLFESTLFKKNLHMKLTATPLLKKTYEKLLWESSYMESREIADLYDLEPIKKRYYGEETEELKGDFGLTTRLVKFEYNELAYDVLTIDKKFRNLLRLVFPLPVDYMLNPLTQTARTDFTYNHENEILEFIAIFTQMQNNKLIEFGKTGEKPLTKTLQLLKRSTPLLEFYSEKKMDTLATDMLARSFYYDTDKDKKKREVDRLKTFVDLQLADKLPFTISRIFASHLKKVRFGYYAHEQQELFNIVKDILSHMPKEGWVSVENIMKYCHYRDYRFDFEVYWKTKEYYMECDIQMPNGTKTQERLYPDDAAHYQILFFEPILKAAFFYMAALGLLEIKYNQPRSKYRISAKEKPYISLWDGLEYIRLSALGKYILGFEKEYTPKKIIPKKSTVKFDEYKPIITVQGDDSLMLAKIDAFAQKYDTNKYILSYEKIFKECKNYKALELKIESFYKQIEANPPKVFTDFFDEIKNSANLLKTEPSAVVITLKKDQRLLDFFIHNPKIKPLIIKAEGYKIIVAKENISKLSKLLKENGFFVSF